MTEAADDGRDWFPEFTCLPVTVTNADGAVLELGDDCTFSFQPPSTTESGVERRAVLTSAVEPPTNVALRIRQDCVPRRTDIATVTTTIPTTIRTTATKTETVKPSDESFTCPEMVVTNTVGDELSLNDDCSLEFTPADEDGTAKEGDSSSGSNNSDTDPEDNDETTSGSAGGTNGTNPDSWVGDRYGSRGNWRYFVLFFMLSMLAL